MYIISLSYFWNQTKTSLSKNVGGFSNHPWTTIIDPTPISSDDVLAAAIYKHLSSGGLAAERGVEHVAESAMETCTFFGKKNTGHGGFFMSLYLLDDLRLFFEGWDKKL